MFQNGVGSEWAELDETVQNKVTRAVQDRFKPYSPLRYYGCARQMQPSQPDPRQCIFALGGPLADVLMQLGGGSKRATITRETMEFNDTLKYSGEGAKRIPDFGFEVKYALASKWEPSQRARILLVGEQGRGTSLRASTPRENSAFERV